MDTKIYVTPTDNHQRNQMLWHPVPQRAGSAGVSGGQLLPYHGRTQKRRGSTWILQEHYKWGRVELSSLFPTDEFL